MLFYLFTELSDQISGLNVFRYITFRTGGALMTSLFLVFMFGPWLISNLRLKQGKGQPIREDGPARHIIEKQGTPTMGGLMILAGIVVSTLLWADLGNLYV
ncbi:MAG: phospho-N-acetylmuramoyl-pentapeptide-transferase, partial [Anderseniella sp.]